MMKIRFTIDRWLDTEDRTKVPRFRKGSTHDLSDASAYRWVRRNVAVYVVAEPVVLDRPMMGGSDEIRKSVLGPAGSRQRLDGSHQKREEAAEADKPKKRGRKAKKPMPKGDATVREIVTGPALPVKGSGKNGGPGWDD